MKGKPINKDEIEKIISMRKTGHSLPEICKFLNRGGSTVYKYAKDVVVLPVYANTLKQKQGGSKDRSRIQWDKSVASANDLLKKIGKRDKLFILAALYWGEGTKSEFDLINGDPSMIRVFISCIKEIGVEKKDLRVSLRIYEDIDSSDAKKYWSKVCGIDMKNILSVNILKGKKIGKLPYGMCRVRVTRGGEHFKLIMSMISSIKLQII